MNNYIFFIIYNTTPIKGVETKMQNYEGWTYRLPIHNTTDSLKSIQSGAIRIPSTKQKPLFFTYSTSNQLSFHLSLPEHLLRGGTMTQELKGIQSLSERLSVPDWIRFIQQAKGKLFIKQSFHYIQCKISCLQRFHIVQVNEQTKLQTEYNIRSWKLLSHQIIWDFFSNY